MNVTTQNDNATSDQATTMPTMAGETGRDLCERRGELSGNARRNIERRWLSLFGMSFSVFEMYDSETVAKYEAAFPVDLKNMRLKRTAPVRIAAGKSPASNEVPVSLPAQNKWRKWCLLFAFAAPTVASVSTTFMVSHAMSGNTVTSLAITAVASSTSLMFLWAGVNSFGSWLVVAATLGFEGFCNAASVFKWLMGDLAYSLTTVSGKPSDFLAMVANFTGKDHQDVATVIAYFTAAMICGAQVSSIYELKK